MASRTSAGAQVAPSRPVDTDINSYVIFGFETVDFKGGNLAGTGNIRGGNVGANGADPGGSSVNVNICANGRAIMSDGSQVVGNSVRFARECQWWDLFANRVVGEGGGTVHSGPTPVSIPVVAEPPFPAITCNPSNPVTVRAGDPPTSLPPGTYGDVQFQNGTDVTLGTGLYQMCNFNTGQHATVRIGPGTELRIAGRFALGDDTQFGVGLACAARIYARGDGVGDNDNTIRFGQDSVVAGHFLTLDGRINLGNQTSLFGTFWANHILSDFNVNVTYCPPLGQFVVSKSIVGPGAGQQGEIQIEIECVPSPPNSSIPPWVIPAGSTGAASTVVTNVTLPAVCRAHETVTGDNDAIDVIVSHGGLALGAPPPEVPICPDVGHTDIDPLTGRRRSLASSQITDFVDTTTTTEPTTTTTTDPSTTTTEGPTTTTTTTAPTTTTDPPDPTVPPDTCMLPTVVTQDPGTTAPAGGGTGGTALARTGGSAGLFVVGSLLALVGAVLAAAGKRQRTAASRSS